MGSKRAYSEVEAPGPSSDGGYKKRKQFKNNNKSSWRNDGSSDPPGQSLNEIKKRARDIQRRFAKADNMPADIQRNLERELAHCKRQIEDLDYKKKRSEMIGRYHHVRFFERQKAERLRKQLKKRLQDASPEEKANLEEELHIADVDWHYAKYYPFMERYNGLYLTAKTSDESNDKPIAKRALHAERPPVWKEIEAAMEQGEDALMAIQERAASSQIALRSHETTIKKPEEPRKHKDKSKRKEQKTTKSRSADMRRSDIVVSGGQKPRQEAEERVAEEGNDGMGFFAVA